MALSPEFTRTITLAFETAEQASRFDEALTCGTAVVPWTHSTVPTYVSIPEDRMDLALAIEHLVARAINGRPFSGNGDPDAYPAKVEVQL